MSYLTKGGPVMEAVETNQAVETNVRRLTLSREIIASFLPEGSLQGRHDGRHTITQTSPVCGASNSLDGSQTYCTCC